MGVAQATSMSSTLNYMGCTIMASNHISQPQGNFVAGDDNYQISLSPFIDPDDDDNQADADRALQGNFRGAIFSRGAVASVRKQGLKVDTVEDVRRNTVFTVASTYMGGGILRPELCASIWNLSGATTAGSSGTYNNGFDNRASRQDKNAGTDVQITV